MSINVLLSKCKAASVPIQTYTWKDDSRQDPAGVMYQCSETGIGLAVLGGLFILMIV